MELGQINIDQYLAKFKVRPEKTLFPPTAWDITYWLIKGKCPLCQKKLYPIRDGKLYICKSKFRDGFKVKGETLAKYSPLDKKVINRV